MKKNNVFPVFLLAVFLVLPAPSIAETALRDLDRLKLVGAQVASIQGEVERLRLEMGKRRSLVISLEMTGVQPHEVYFQAYMLFHKANRLCFDFTSNLGPIPPQMKGEGFSTEDILAILNLAIDRVQCVGKAISADSQIEDSNFPSPENWDDLYNMMFDISRQLNVLFDNPHTPSSVFRYLDRIVSQVSYLIGRENAQVDRVNIPGFVHAKQPRDVFIQVARCFIIVSRLAKSLDVKTMELDFGDNFSEKMDPINPSDVYDLVSLTGLEIDRIEYKLLSPGEGKFQMPKTPFPGRKLPAHVFQEAAYLEQLLLFWESSLIKRSGKGRL